MTIITSEELANLPERLETDIAIAGAGPAGLSLALDLGLQGIRVVLLDGEVRRDSEDRVRRANAINNRAMEYMRRLGVSEAINAAVDVEPQCNNLDVSFVTSLVGDELYRFVNAFESSPDMPPPDLSPECYRRINQVEIEAIIRARIADLDNVMCIEGCKLDGLSQDQTGVTAEATLLETGGRLTVTALFLAGCDGGTSTVRKLGDFKLSGEGGLARNINITYRGSAVHQANVHPYASMYWIVNDHFDGYIGASPAGGRLTVFDVDDEKFEEIRADPLAVISAAVGKPVTVEPVSLDRWQTHHLIAGEYRRGRIFLAGDAAHMHPPTGGLGMNTGLGDISNLGWKLGAYLKGWAGEDMLDSYDTERRPIGARVVSQSNLQYAQPARSFRRPDLAQPGADGEAARAAAAADIRDRKSTEFFSRGLVLGQTYVPSSVVLAEDGPIVNADIISYTPTAQPGARLPHLFIYGQSIYDRLERNGFTLVVGNGGDPVDIAVMASLAEAGGVPFSVLMLPDVEASRYEANYVLVRPDHHVAWRGNQPFGSFELGRVTGFHDHGRVSAAFNARTA